MKTDLGLPLCDQAAGVLLCISQRLFRSAGLSAKSGPHNEAFEMWKVLRRTANQMLVARNTRIAVGCVDETSRALQFAHASEHVHLALKAVIPPDRCPCMMAQYIRELQKIRDEALVKAVSA